MAILLPIFAHVIINRLENAGFSAWVVGGCVRDSLRGQCPHDWDFATSARPEQIVQVFAGERVHLTGARHGTVTVGIDGNLAEITTYRAEYAYSDGRRPDEVRFLNEVYPDLARRDFTINAMAYHPVRGLCDPFGGRQDLQNGVIRAVGNADQRFGEDALRILRGVRFAAKTGFSIVPNTAHAMRRQLLHLDRIASERVMEELTGILTGQYVGRALRDYREIIAAVLPEVAPMFGLCQHNPHHCYDVWEHTVRAVEAVRPQDVLRWTLLMHDSGKPHTFTIDAQGIGHFHGHPKVSAALTRQAFTRLRARKALREAVEQLVELHDDPLGQELHIVRRRLARLGEPTVRHLLAVKKADYTGQETFSIHLAELQQTETLVNRICAEQPCLTLRDLALDGHAIQKIGFSGADIGRVLRRLLMQVIEQNVPNQPEALCALALQWKEKHDV